MGGRVAEISVAPVKGLALLHPDRVQLGRDGAAGDRAFFLVDERGAMVNAKRLGALLSVVPSHDVDAGMLALAFPDGTVVRSEVGLGASETVRFYGRPASGSPVRGPFSEALSAHAGQVVRLFARDGRPGVDRGRGGGVSLLSRASVDRLAREVGGGGDDGAGGGPVDHRRFRMLFLVDGVAAHAEDGWIGARVRVGEALIAVEGNVGRCAVTTRHPDTGEVDFPTLKLIEGYRATVPTTERLPFGVYGEVLEPGAVAVGDAVAVAG